MVHLSGEMVFVLLVIIIISRSSCYSLCFRRDFSTLRIQILIKFISIDSYFHEVHAFGTFITSTKVFRLKICKTL